MKQHLTKTYYEVRTKGDGEFDWFAIPPFDFPAFDESEARYDHNSRESALSYAATVNGFVVEVTEKTITHTL